MNGHCTVSGNRSAIASNKPKKNAPRSTQAALRIIHAGGSCGNISDSTSIDPRGFVGVLIIDLASNAQLLAPEGVIESPLRRQLVVRPNLGRTSPLWHHHRI